MKNHILVLLNDLYARVFVRNWPVWLGGLLIGVISIATFAWSRPLGVVGGLREWIDWSFYYLGVYRSHPTFAPLMSSSSILTFSLIWGALASALLSKQFAVKVPPPFEIAKGAMGGVFMGVGATMAAGCNVGGFLSATSALSLGGLAMMAGLVVGAFLEVRYVYWELERIRFRRGDGRPRRPKPGSLDWKRVQPYGGALLLLAGLGGAYLYQTKGIDTCSGYSYVEAGGLLLLGLAFGFVLHRSRFAFVQAFRGPFATGNADHSQGMVIAVLVSVGGCAMLKAWGVKPEWVYVAPTFWTGSFMGGILFGFGMSCAGGCGSGTCWRLAEGGMKQLIAFIFLGISNSISTWFLGSNEALSSMLGKRLFLPHYLSYQWSVVLIVAVLLIFYRIVTWNEKTRALV